MLGNNRICTVQTQNFPILQEKYLLNEIRKTPCCLLMSLHDMFVAKQDMCKLYADEAYKLFACRGWADEDYYVLRYEQLATYGVLMNTMLWGYNVSTGSMNIYTSSYTRLSALAQNGYLKGKKLPIALELEEFKEKLVNSQRVKKTIREGGRFFTARIDFEKKGSKVEATFTVPRTLPSFDDTIFIPVSAYQKVVEMLSNEMRNSILRITIGDKVRDVTLNQGLLEAVYGGSHTKSMLSYMPEIYTKKFYVPNIGASKYLIGVTNIQLEAVDSVVPITLTDVDMSEVNTNYDMVVDYFKMRVNSLGDAELGEVGELLGVGFLNAPEDDLRRRVLEEADTIFPSELWKFMKDNDRYFNTDRYNLMPNKFGDKYEPVDIPRTVAELSYVLGTGAFKVIITKRNGSFSTIYCTTSPDVVEMVVGSKFMDFESLGVRARGLKRTILSDRGIDLNGAIKHYRLEKYVGGSYQEVLSQVEVLLGAVEESRTVVNNPKLLHVRCLTATSKETYYRMIDLYSIREIFRLS